MKEQYFAPGSIKKESLALLEDIQSLVRVKNPSLIPGSTPGTSALLVLDMQRFFLDPQSHAFIPSAPAIVPGILKLRKMFVDNDMPVIYTRHVNTPADGGLMNFWWCDLIRPGNPLSLLIEELPAPLDGTLDKTRYDAFLYTGLEERLKQMGVRQVIITGVMTHLCCESTARSAFMRDFEVLFAIDGTATYNRQFHHSTLLNLAHGFAVPLLVEDIMEKMAKKT